MVKTYLKTLVRTFKKHITRLLSIIFIVLVSVGFVSGIGMAVDKINYSLTDYYIARNVSDFIMKSERGFAQDDIDKMITRYGEKNVNAGLSLDVKLSDEAEEPTRLYFLKGETTVNKRKMLDGELPRSTFEAGAEEADNFIKGIPLGTEITLDFAKIFPFDAPSVTVTVTSTERSPLTFGMDKEPSYLNGNVEIPDNIEGVNALKGIENILYLSYDLLGDMPATDLYVSISDRNLFHAFSARYNDFIEKEKTELISLLGEDVHVITLSDNYSFSALHAYAQKVSGICWVLMAAFLLVTALVALSTMTRLIDEERAQVAYLKTLGYPAWRILFKYLLFAAIALGIGGTGGYFVGLGIARLLYVVFNYSFTMPPMSTHVTLVFFFIVFSVIVAVTLLATAFSGIKLTGETPANLLRPKAPKRGKKVFLERIPFLWNLLPFKYKSTTRNVLRFKNRFLMTVIAVAFSTTLVIAGLALLDLCLFQGLNSPTLTAVSLVVVFFAGLLTASVIYTLTNINISERNRELATLMVLGYYDGEVAGYIYREVYIDTVIGVLLGLPLSLAILKIVFDIMAVGTIATMSWFVWLIAPAVVLLFTAFVTLLLRRKIVKVDMNESLKAIE